MMLWSDCYKHSDSLSCCIGTDCHTALGQVVILHWDRLYQPIPIYTTTYTHIYNNNKRGCHKKRALMFLVETFRLLLAIYYFYWAAFLQLSIVALSIPPRAVIFWAPFNTLLSEFLLTKTIGEYFVIGDAANASTNWSDLLR